jgi:sugar/nucleoside kinase (ribokinase family)
MSGRFVLLGSVLVDVVLYVPALPPRGGDVLATDSLLATGGGFNAMAAASRQGRPAAYAGRHGTGRFGDQARMELGAEGIELLLPVTADGDTGFCIGMVDAEGERTYATREGVEGALSSAELASVAVPPGDQVYLSGYDLLYEHGPRVAAWYAALPDSVVTLFDPGPLVATLDPSLLATVLARADWVSANRSEAESLPTRESGLVVRSGAEGCWVDGVHVPVMAVTAVDTAGAGDAHVGAFAAALGRGLEPVEAARWANAAAARSVTVKGPSAAPTYAVTEADLQA